MSESNECCGECDASRKSYPVGTCAYAGDCPCHSTTPDTEWEKEVREEWDRYNNGKFCSLDCTIDFIAHLLTSRNTYWKERVRSKREALAELEHIQWIAWSKNIAETEQITPARLERWKKLWRPYSELTEAEKDQDREWADQALNTLLDNLKWVRHT